MGAGGKLRASSDFTPVELYEENQSPDKDKSGSRGRDEKKK
jgi:hypothetical protein